MLFFAPISPGEKQLVAEYVLPAGVRETGLTLEQGLTRLNILATEPGVDVTGAGIAPADTQVIEGRSYRRWSVELSCFCVLDNPRWAVSDATFVLMRAMLQSSMIVMAAVAQLPRRRGTPFRGALLCFADLRLPTRD